MQTFLVTKLLYLREQRPSFSGEKKTCLEKDKKEKQQRQNEKNKNN